MARNIVPPDGVNSLTVGTKVKRWLKGFFGSVDVANGANAPVNSLQRSTAYAAGDIVQSDLVHAKYFLKCTTAGTTGSTDPNFAGVTSGSTVTDGTAVWTVQTFGSEEALDNYLPLSGGTINGTLGVRGSVFGSAISGNLFIIGNSEPNTDGYTGLYGANSYNNGAALFVYGKDNSTGGGRFDINAYDGTNRIALIGTPSGSLTWNGKEVERVNSSGTNYIRYENGLQLYYQSVLIPANTTNGVKIFTYSVPFVSVASIQATPLGVADGKLITFVSVLNRSGSQFQIQVATATNTVPTYDAYVHIFVVGRWK